MTASKTAYGTRWCHCLILSLILLSAVVSATEPLDQPKTSYALASQEIEFTDYNLHYTSSGRPDAPGILFIHGTPGSWQAFDYYLNNQSLQRNYFIVSIDRPGWGKSGAPKLAVTGSFHHQASAIAAILKRYPEKKWLLVGHSLGASLAPQVLLAAPESISAMLLLAGSLRPKLGKPRWYNRLANSWLIGWMVPADLKASNDEIMVLESELAEMESALLKINSNAKVVVVQGMRDRLVSPKNLSYVAQTWPAIFPNLEVVELPDAGHFLPWNNTEQILEIINRIKF